MLHGLLLGLLLLGAATPLDQWSRKHADASQALAEWVKKNPDASNQLFRWDGLHPERTKDFVSWAIDNTNVDVVAFRTKHQDWPEFQQLLDKQRLALNDFAQWARQHSDAAKDLMEHPRGLEWAGKHLYGKQARSRQARTK